MRSFQPEPLDPEDIRRAADEILSRPEYREPEPSLVDRVLTAITDFLGNAFATLTGGGAGNVIGLVVVVLLLVLAAWLLARALGAAPRRGSAPAAGVVQGTSAPDDPHVWRAEADRLAGAGDHRGALRCRYQALIAGMVRSGVVEEVPARTPAELRRELSGRRPEVDPPLASVTERFEATWYGGRPVDATEYAVFAREVEAIEAAELRPTAVRA